jgi:hypothetical protein
MLQVKVPFLQPAELDRAANELLHRYGEWRHEPAAPPIDVDEIVEGYLGLSLEVVDLKGHLGMDDVLHGLGSAGSVSIEPSRQSRDGSHSQSLMKSATGSCIGRCSSWRS